MPAILRHEFQDAWLDPRTDRTVLAGMLKPFPSLRMKTYPVSGNVNSPDNDSADLLVRVDIEVGQTLSLF
jgi:putative SOS response-associated peptidase YedK